MTQTTQPYATATQTAEAWEHFVPGTGRTAEVSGVVFELAKFDGFHVWVARNDDTGDHYAIDEAEARSLGLI